jgi:hypothetical protein
VCGHAHATARTKYGYIVCFAPYQCRRSFLFSPIAKGGNLLSQHSPHTVQPQLRTQFVKPLAGQLWYFAQNLWSGIVPIIQLNLQKITKQIHE